MSCCRLQLAVRSRSTPLTCATHEPGTVDNNGRYSHPEQPSRLIALQDALRTKWQPEMGSLLQVREPDVDVTRQQMLRVHSVGHVSRLEDAFSRAFVFRGKVVLDRADTVASAGTRNAARRAAGLVIAAVDDIFSRENLQSKTAPRRASVMARPLGTTQSATRRWASASSTMY